MNNEKFKIYPSLSINVTDTCNLKCIYCPPYGENFIKCTNICNIESIIKLINILSKYRIPVVRITGGEPLLYPKRVEAILKACKKCFISKVILNTNGVKVLENIDWMNKYKESFLLKVSLDAVEKDLYNIMTNTKGMYIKVIESIEAAVSYGFRIEINTVVTKKI